MQFLMLKLELAAVPPGLPPTQFRLMNRSHPERKPLNHDGVTPTKKEPNQ